MSVTRIVCPHCSQHLQTPKAVAVGQRARCPHCHQAFTVAADRSPAAPALQTVPMPPPPAIRRSRARLWTAIILGGVLLLMGISAGLVISLGEKTPNSGQKQDGASPSTDGRDNADSEVLSQEATPHQDAANSPWLSPQRQAAVDAAIQRGVNFLKQKELDSGTWSDEYHPAGLAALPALTLLECGVAADEGPITKALEYVRDAAPHLDSTYEIALVLLFLERRNDRADRPLIRRLALRLVAGQTPAGGWSYECPILPAEQEDNLLAVLEALRPNSHEDLFVKEPVAAVREKAEPSGQRPEDLDGKAKEAYAALPPALQRLPSLHPPSDSHQLPLADHSDNSNTQFAALGLWAAGRQGLPVERALALTAARFRFSPSLGGGWDYHYAVLSHASTPSMTCAGLLGLALGHGLIVQHKSHPTHSAKVDDAVIQRGMQTLAGFLDEPRDYADKKDRPSINLYYLWSLGRVGLLYRARKIGGKDWYAWGVNQVLAWQEADGSWKANVYPDANAAPILNTCFALLFLQRSHLTKELSKTLEFKLESKQLDENRQ